MAKNRHHRPGFSLIEIMIVLVVLGILASMVIPKFASADMQAEQAVFARSIRRFNEAAQIYINETGQYPEDSSSGQLPSGWGPYVDERAWITPTPIGGVWDFELNSFGFTSGFGVHFMDPNEQPDDEFMVGIDRIIDDGDLATGSFRKIDANRFYNILVE